MFVLGQNINLILFLTPLFGVCLELSNCFVGLRYLFAYSKQELFLILIYFLPKIVYF